MYVKDLSDKIFPVFLNSYFYWVSIKFRFDVECSKMEWDDDDGESNENAESLNKTTEKSETTTKVHLRKVN